MLQAWKVKSLHFTPWFNVAIEFQVPAILKLEKVSKLNFGDMLFKSKESKYKKSWSYSAHFFVISFVLFMSQEFGNYIFICFKMAIILKSIVQLLCKVKWKSFDCPGSATLSTTSFIQFYRYPETWKRIQTLSQSSTSQHW